MMENNIDIEKLNRELSDLQSVLAQRVPAGMTKEDRAKSQAILREEKDKARARIKEINKTIKDYEKNKLDDYVPSEEIYNLGFPKEKVDAVVEEFNTWRRKQYGDKSLKERQSLGAFFTPPELTLKMVKQHLDNGLAPGKTMLDPTCGAGNLLAPAIILGVVNPEDVYGMDLDPESVDIARERLGALGVPAINLRQGDALKPESYDQFEKGDTPEEEAELIKELGLDESKIVKKFNTDNVNSNNDNDNNNNTLGNTFEETKVEENLDNLNPREKKYYKFMKEIGKPITAEEAKGSLPKSKRNKIPMISALSSKNSNYFDISEEARNIFSGALDPRSTYIVDARDEDAVKAAKAIEGIGAKANIKVIDNPKFMDIFYGDGILSEDNEKYFMYTMKDIIGNDDLWSDYNNALNQSEYNDLDALYNVKSDDNTEENKEPTIDTNDIDIEETVKQMEGGTVGDKPVMKSEKIQPEVEEPVVEDKQSVEQEDSDNTVEEENPLTQEEVDKILSVGPGTDEDDTIIQDSVSNILGNMHFNENDVSEEQNLDIPEPDVLSDEEAAKIQADQDAEDEAFIREAEAKEAANRTKEQKLNKANKIMSEAEKDFANMAGATPDPDPTDADNISYGKDETTMGTGEHIPDNDDKSNLPAINAPVVRKPTDVGPAKPIGELPEKDDNIIDAEYTIRDAEPVEEPVEEEEEEEKPKKEHHMPNLGLTDHTLGGDFEAHVNAMKVSPSETHSETVQVSDKKTKNAKKNNTNTIDSLRYFDTPDRTLASDERLKKLFGDDDRVACIAKINSYDFRYKPEAQEALGIDGDLHTGVIAQELEDNPAFKGVVTEHDGTKMLKIPELTASNTAAIGDIARKVEELSQMMTELKDIIGDRK